MRFQQFTLAVAGALVLASCSGRNESSDELAVAVMLTPQLPDQEAERSIKWSPKGEKLPLAQVGDALSTSLALGPAGTAPFDIRLTKSEHAEHFDRLFIDLNRDGDFGEGELLETDPEEIRNKIWSSFAVVVDVPVVDPVSGNGSVNPYALSFWYVDDPRVEDEDLVLRYSRRGWMEGTVMLDGIEAVVLLTESTMDGVYDREDYWALASRDSASDVLSYEYSRPLEKHAWLFQRAYGVDEIDPSGRRLTLIPVDPGITRADEAEMDDYVAVDRRAARSGRTVTFGHDFEQAEATARNEDKALFIDFETTWCGPCKVMDEWVYTADDVVDAAMSVVSVKVDGDDHPELAERFEVVGYPTMILLSPEGVELGRLSGYVSVKGMTQFFSGDEH